MTPQLQVVSVAHDLKSISLTGDEKSKYLSHPGARLYKIHVRESLLIRFPTVLEGRDFIQKMIDDGVPFIDAERTYAYSDVMEFISEGKLHGKPVRSIWKNGEYVIHE